MNEHTKNAITASVGFVPILGGALSVLFDKYIPTTFEKKRDDFFRYIDSEFEKLGIDENSSILEEEKFMMLFTKCFKRAMDEHSEEKIKAFQHVILNSATIENENLDETTFFIRLISDLTIDQFRILSLVENEEFKHQTNLIHAVCEKFNGADESYVKACVTELIRFNLFSNSQTNQELMKQRNFFTPLGKRFINYISWKN